MNLNIKDWRYYKISDLFDTYTGGDLIIGDIEEGNIPVASNSSENNNIATYTSVIDGRKLFNHNISISIADRGKFWAFIQPRDFYIGTRAKALVSKKTDLTINQLAFVTTIINQESFKFSYGRNCCHHLPELQIKLPSVDNQTPDWEFMENFIRGLNFKHLTSLNISQNVSITLSEWKNFNLEKLFSIKRGERIVKNDDYFDEKSEENCFPVVTTTTYNNGIDGWCNQYNCNGNCIVSAGEASGMFTTYQKEPCWCLDTVRIYTPKGFSINKYNALFFGTILTSNMFRYSYGRKAKRDNMYKINLLLPIKHNADGTPFIDETHKFSDEGYVPDFEFMENYIKSLPYGDHI